MITAAPLEHAPRSPIKPAGQQEKRRRLIP